MTTPKWEEMPFAKLYPLLVAKAEKKGRTWEEAHQATAWLTRYGLEERAQNSPM